MATAKKTAQTASTPATTTTPVTQTDEPTIDLNALSDRELNQLADELKRRKSAKRDANKANRAAEQANREKADRERREADASFLGDSTRLVVRANKFNVTTTTQGSFHRYTGQVEVDGVTYNVMLVAKPAKR